MGRHSLLIWTTLSLGLHLVLLLTLPDQAPVRSGDRSIPVRLRPAPGIGDPRSQTPPIPTAMKTRPKKPNPEPAVTKTSVGPVALSLSSPLPKDTSEKPQEGTRAGTSPSEDRKRPPPKQIAPPPESPQKKTAPPEPMEGHLAGALARASAADPPPEERLPARHAFELPEKGNQPAVSELSDARPSAGTRNVSTEATPRYDLNPPPPYPRSALRRRWEGTALVRVKVTADGWVRDAALHRSSGYPILDRSALEAVRTWRFHPATRNDEPVEAEVVVPLTFKISLGR